MACDGQKDLGVHCGANSLMRSTTSSSNKLFGLWKSNLSRFLSLYPSPLKYCLNVNMMETELHTNVDDSRHPKPAVSENLNILQMFYTYFIHLSNCPIISEKNETLCRKSLIQEQVLVNRIQFTLVWGTKPIAWNLYTCIGNKNTQVGLKKKIRKEKRIIKK